MIHIDILSVGHKEEGWLRAARETYTTRLGRYCTVRCTALKESPPSPTKQQQESLRLQTAMQQHNRTQHTWRIALTERGHTYTSPAFAQRIADWQQTYSRLLFVIGGADGFAPSLYDHVHHQLALSHMTLPHMLCRIVLLEQLYRAFTLLTDHPYHRD